MTGKRNLTAAIIGAGITGQVHVRAARLAGSRIAGIVASTPESTAVAAHRLNVRAYSCAEAAIEDPSVDVIHICTPNATHHGFVMAALTSGKHVICEKPLTAQVGQAAELAAAADRADRVATVPFIYRYHPMIREARARIQRNGIGALQMIHGSYLQDWLLEEHDTNWRVDPQVGGASRAFADIGSHWCDLVEWVTGERFASVIACLRTTVSSRPMQSRRTFATGVTHGAPNYRPVVTEDVAGLLFNTTRGVLATLSVSQVSAGRKNRLWFEIDGSKSSIVFDQEDAERLWVGTRDATTLLVRDPTRGSQEQRRLASLPAGHTQGYAHCFEAFVEDTYATIRGERRDGLPTFEDGARSARIIAAVLKSSRKNQWQRIS